MSLRGTIIVGSTPVALADDSVSDGSHDLEESFRPAENHCEPEVHPNRALGSREASVDRRSGRERMRAADIVIFGVSSR